jgi:nicotinate-nucleotide adenylyltransferase
MMNLKRLALYGGTFDPVHHGHLLLARDALEELELDRVVFVPAGLSPHKLATSPAPSAVRREMLAAALADEAGFTLDDSELDGDGPSFTIDSVERIRATHPEAKLYYLIGADNLRELHTWRRYADLCQLVEFVVLGRGEHAAPAPEGFRTLARRVDISATEIRRRVARGQSIRYLVPEPVRSLITSHHLYQDPSHQI